MELLEILSQVGIWGKVKKNAKLPKHFLLRTALLLGRKSSTLYSKRF
jgi:hypothetical protein